MPCPTGDIDNICGTAILPTILEVGRAGTYLDGIQLFIFKIHYYLLYSMYIVQTSMDTRASEFGVLQTNSQYGRLPRPAESWPGSKSLACMSVQ